MLFASWDFDPSPLSFFAVLFAGIKGGKSRLGEMGHLAFSLAPFFEVIQPREERGERMNMSECSHDDYDCVNCRISAHTFLPPSHIPVAGNRAIKGTVTRRTTRAHFSRGPCEF